MPIIVKLKEILAERNMSQRELARLTGLRPNTISHLCSNEVDRVHLSTFEVICKTLDIELHDLIVMEDE
ncbi:helix-turn-helix transcriptional regulator [Brevibacillus sp. HB1.2]|uniref:Transcriptional regulator n=1 Tax=Brevibacillus formosus TaxID=54913 RepID=A0A220MAW6_9BACL|nr:MULTISPECIES: helix-turn-helix transcriptional regulator [Paenibacillaceae]WGV61164.1 helix-turn-helix transcriptional regulator [Brevibacillus brevis]ASJ52136.1 transcriptional regulator [Brevibacillus formosus]KPV55626.1 transcriptional regulator [Paenibacillus sp. A3]MDC0763049.1 helix-turn-helix transcriptional regulator [Brevibacillus sp. AG]MED1781413.1 helix-turn-helix transcriptional regulator [Brevibacillus fortis]